MSDIYKLQYDGMTLTYPGWNGFVSYEYSTAFKTLTLYNSEGGTLTANKLTGYPGETINLTTAYDTYWRFSGYQLTGDGLLVGNDYTFGTEDATICACFKPNAFTATGGWEKGSDLNATANKRGSNSPTFRLYAVNSYRTSNVPTSWYATSNRWNPSNASAYKITLNPKCTGLLKFPGQTSMGATAQVVTLVNTTQNQNQTFTEAGKFHASNSKWSYNKSFTSDSQTVYSISGRLKASYYNGYASTATYVATGTTGSWTATGYAP